MSRVAIILIVGSIFIVMLSQTIARNANFTGPLYLPEVILTFGLLYCVMKIYISWLGAPSANKAEDENNDQHNEK